jgi:hypothetical protein
MGTAPERLPRCYRRRALALAMSILSANPAVRRREEAFLVRARLEAIDAKLDKLVVMGKGVAPATPAPAFSAANIEEVGKLLVEGRMIRLPAHARLTVTTTIEEVRSKIFGTSEVFTHTADQIHTKLLRPMTILECLEAGLIRRIPNGWAWSEMTYERLSASA